MKYVFLIGSEHQLMQVDFAINHFHILSEDLILLVQEISTTNKLSSRIKDNPKYGVIHSFENWKFIDLFKLNKNHINFVNICLNIKAKHKKITFFTSHYSDDSTFLFFSVAKPMQFFLMDEGTASYSVLLKRNDSFSSLKFKLFIKSILYTEILKPPSSITYFTRFNFIPGINDKKEFYKVEKVDNTIELNFNQFGFLGSSVVELNMMDEGDYLFYLKKIAFQNRNKQLLYFKHRKEENVKLSKVEIIGFQVIDLDLPFERHFESQVIIPSVLSSFFTTSVLINISENFRYIPKLEINVFPMTSLKRERLIYENILKYLEKDTNFNIIYHD